MAIKDIHLENITLKTNKGAEISEAQGITLKNVRFECKETNPVIKIDNSSAIKFDGLKYTNGANLLFSVSGNRTKQISVMNTDASKAKNKITFSAGADSKAVTF
jgi:hypothetical protein